MLAGFVAPSQCKIEMSSNMSWSKFSAPLFLCFLVSCGGSESDPKNPSSGNDASTSDGGDDGSTTDAPGDTSVNTCPACEVTAYTCQGVLPESKSVVIASPDESGCVANDDKGAQVFTIKCDPLEWCAVSGCYASTFDASTHTLSTPLPEGGTAFCTQKP